MPIANPNVGSFEGKSYLAAKLWFHLTLLLSPLEGEEEECEIPGKKLFQGSCLLLGKEEKMASDLADEIFGKKTGRIISEWLRMSDQAAAVSWISIFRDCC